MPDVLCLRPEADFTRVGVAPPKTLEHHLHVRLPTLPMPKAVKAADALVIPAVGPKLRSISLSIASFASCRSPGRVSIVSTQKD